MTATPEFDGIDFRIMEMLRRDGRTPVLELARVIGAPETTVRKRLKRLLEQGFIRVVAVSSARALGYKRELVFTIKTEPGKALDVARQLAGVDAVRFVAFGMGSFDLLVNTIFRTEEELFEFVTKWLAVDGIASYQSTDLMAVFKRSFDWLVDRELIENGKATGRTSGADSLRSSPAGPPAAGNDEGTSGGWRNGED